MYIYLLEYRFVADYTFNVANKKNCIFFFILQLTLKGKDQKCQSG